IKLVPLGHSAGQRLLRELSAKLEGVVERGMKCSDDELGMSLPGLAIASARHETQYTRLFRS
ncbi:MAG: urease accessory protein UreF, partial [Gammaproteobacteria bacterium]|nr:urease accessory protein UreF [Gammaproteobacteria bacterium]